jgi:HAD superfamily hydrolase (TIGR01509 family)
MPADALPVDALPADGPDAVLWDMDGTLVDSEKLWTISIAETARWLGGELSAAARTRMVGSDMSATLDILFDDLGLPRDPARQDAAAAWMTERTGELFAAGLEWRPGALDALRTVSAAGWPMALVTNTQRVLTEPALDAIGRDFFRVSVCGDEVPRGKPAPDPYLRAAELLGIAPERCLVVEDSVTGAEAGRRAGAAVLVVPCEVAVPAAPRRVRRDSLVGLSAVDVVGAYRTAVSRPAA